MSSIIIEDPRDGERQRVQSIAGYEGFTVIATDVPDPPHDHCTWDDEAGAWVEDAEALAAAERGAAFRAMPREELVARLLAVEDALVVTQALATAAATTAGMTSAQVTQTIDQATPPPSATPLPPPPDLNA